MFDYDDLQHLLPGPRASLQGTVSIGVDKIPAGSFWGFVPDEPEKVHVLHVPWSVREAHAHQVLRGRPQRVVCHGRGGAERDGHGGGASAIPTHGTSANPGGTTA